MKLIINPDYSMENLLLFGFKNLIFTGVLWIAYRFFISGNTFHQANRIIILLIFAGGILLPFTKINLPEFNFLKEVQTSSDFLLPLVEKNDKIEVAKNTNNQLIYNILITIYGLGVLFFSFRYIIGLVSLIRILKNSQKKQLPNGVFVHITTENVLPFSWFKYIVLSEKNPTYYSENVIFHEMAHADYRHSWDLLFAELYRILFWWNPFVWLLKKELMQVHEFQADQKAIQQTNNANLYRKELIIQCVGAKKVAFAHNFETSNLKKRIYMTMRDKSTGKAKWSYGTLILATSAVMFLFSNETLQAQEKETKNTSEIEVVGHKNTKNQDIINDPEVIVILDEKKVENYVLQQINPDKIASISVLKDKKSIGAYGEKGKKGVIKVTTKKLSTEPNKEVEKSKITNDALLIVDGKELDISNLEKIDPKNIESITVLKNKKSTDAYGEKGKNGVILVVTKK
ncbi:M56 family metallopeptidase [Capnocytophaga stomatis]|uniref:M56 family metallopeptidase n=1 Tax=Capnocytophaga stomatis TaxID=1848904 RepID=UPI00385A7154